MSWATIAPAKPANPRDPRDPAYHWPADVDSAVRQARRYHIAVSLMLINTPGWANGNGDPAYAPLNPRDFADFAEAAARRYPSVHRWMVWGEPLRGERFLPQAFENTSDDDLGPVDSAHSAAARSYARLLDAAYGRLKRVSRSNLVIGGNITTNGWTSPYNWIRYMRLPDGRPPRMDLFGDNPFGTRRPDLAADQIYPKQADFCDLDVVAGWLDRYFARAGRNRRLRFFISEYTAPTAPGGEFLYHVTPAVQASWLRSAFAIARSWWRIETLGWIPLRDYPRTGGVEAEGLIDLHGVRKPAYYVYKRAGR